ncbi:MAG: EAL domain-containing protein [Lachnospiraceae bacterium]|nr:EAL domain-containing protein [Lachnospiraceae bacterium]
MNIKTQCCGVALLVMLLVIYSKQRKLELASGRVFRVAYFVTMFCLGMDMLSVVMIVNQARIPVFLVLFVCKTYLVTLILVGYAALAYVGTDICRRKPQFRRQLCYYGMITAAFALLIYCLPISLYANADGSIVYSYGPSTWATYVGALFFVLANLFTLVSQKGRIYERQRRAVIIWMGMWIVAALIQFLNSQLLVVGFACALGVSVIFFQFENPELHLDRKSGLFNYMAYTRYMEQLYSGEGKFFVIAVLLENAFQWDIHLKRTEELVAEFADLFLELPGACVFKTMEDEILLVFTEQVCMEQAWEYLQQELPARMGQCQDIQCIPNFYCFRDARCVNSDKELLDLVRYVRGAKKDTLAGSFQLVENSVAERMFSERAMTQKIREALAEDRVEVYYQPIFSIKEQRFTSAEALVRILERDGSMVAPASFIHIAESNGMILEIGKRVFEKVCDFFVQESLADYGVRYIEVNLSVVQCADTGLARDYIRIMDNFGLSPGYINLEITESASTRAKRRMIENMQKLLDYGVSFSLDDFGTGHSNLNYIVDMPVQLVKFDREMIQAYFTNDKAKYVMDAAMHMIQGMELGIVAEGIETEEQYRVMEEIKINYIQGYYFSKPLPGQEFLNFLRQKGQSKQGMEGRPG